MPLTLQKKLPEVFTTLLAIFLFLPCFAMQARAYTGASGSDTVANSGASQGKDINKDTDEASAAVGDADSGKGTDEDSADIPPLARPFIDEQTYFRLRNEQAAEKRGIPDLMNDPYARSRAIRVLEVQEEFLRNLRAQAAASGFSPLSAPVLSWSFMGPDPLPNGQTTGTEVPVSGRVTAIAIDPADASGNIAYVGTAQGGLYRTLDGGATWLALMDSAESLAIGAITIDPTNHDIVFVGTGEGNQSLDSFFGVGLYIVQGATTVTPTVSGPFNSNGSADIFTGRAITKILVNPSDHNKILVSSVSGASGMSGSAFNLLPARGVYLSTNALSGSPTFSLVSIQGVTNRSVTDMAMDPGNPATIVVNVFGLSAAGDGGLWTSTAGDPWAGPTGATWTQEVTKQAIGKLAVNRSGGTPATTFFATFDETASCTPTASTARNVGGTMSKSTNGGVTWTPVPAATGFCGGQCFYDMVTVIDPTNVNNMFIGGAARSSLAVGNCGSGNYAKSTDGGATFTQPDGSLHADTHAIAIAPANVNVIYHGNDGGIFRSTDGGATWSSLNTVGFSATQFESLAIHPTDPNFTIGGTQDNGTEYLNPAGTWTRADFGDGGFSAIDQSAADTTNVTMYHTYFNSTNSLIGYAQTTTAGTTEGSWNFFGCQGSTSNNGFTFGDSVLFYAPLALGPGTPNTLYFGTDRLYRSSNQGVAMSLVSQGPLVASTPISAIGISQQDDNVRMVGLTNGQVWATTTGATTLTNITGAWPAKYVARVVVDPNLKNVAYVTLDGYGTVNHIWKTTNLLAPTPTWTATGFNVDVPVNAFAVDPANTNYLYAGTDIGVYNSLDGGVTWNPYGAGLPRVAVFDLKIHPVARKVRVATHGKGIWQIAAVASLTDSTALSAPASASLGISVTLTATVNHTGGAVPTGAVTFSDGVTILGTGALNGSAVATFSTSSLALGAHNITAIYAGDSSYATSISAVSTVTIAATPDYSISTTTSSATVAAGQSATYTITVTPVNGFASSVSFSCSGLPTGASCSFSPASITPSGSAVSATATISTTSRTLAQAVPASSGNSVALAAGLPALGIMGLVFFGGAGARKRRLQSLFLLSFALLAGTLLLACGGSKTPQPNPNGTPAGTSTVTVTATAGSTTHQTTVTLVVQ